MEALRIAFPEGSWTHLGTSKHARKQKQPSPTTTSQPPHGKKTTAADTPKKKATPAAQQAPKVGVQPQSPKQKLRSRRGLDRRRRAGV